MSCTARRTTRARSSSTKSTTTRRRSTHIARRRTSSNTGAGACNRSPKAGSRSPAPRSSNFRSHLTRRKRFMANPFVHVELNTSDVDKAKAFYSGLFGWKLEDTPMGDGTTYTMIDVGDGTGGGMMKHPMPGAPSMWLPYVLVDDIKASTQK